jgi:hypothetical protein
MAQRSFPPCYRAKMTDTIQRTGSGGLPPSNIIAGNTYNPIAGTTTDHPTSFPPGTPVIQSLSVDGTVIPGMADDIDTSSIVGLAVIPGVADDHALVQFRGPLALTTAQWDVITGGSGGLTRGVPYYLSPDVEGQITTTAPGTTGQFIVVIGVALSDSEMMIQICCPEEAHGT